jgi:mannose-6-phosphate isomerase-like protein (cupin superfamily)
VSLSQCVVCSVCVCFYACVCVCVCVCVYAWGTNTGPSFSPHYRRSDSFYFVDGKLIMHNKAEYAYDSANDGAES